MFESKMSVDWPNSMSILFISDKRIIIRLLSEVGELSDSRKPCLKIRKNFGISILFSKDEMEDITIILDGIQLMRY